MAKINTCGPGWDRLIDPLVHACLEEGIMPVQIKEKFGTLRFYTDKVGSFALERRIGEAERASAHICENCGEPANLRRASGWLKTLCHACFTKYLKARNLELPNES